MKSETKKEKEKKEKALAAKAAKEAKSKGKTISAEGKKTTEGDKTTEIVANKTETITEVVDNTEITEVTEVVDNTKGDQTMAPAWIFNLAFGMRGEIQNATGVGPVELHEQVYGKDGVMKNLESYIPKLPIEKREEFRELLKLIKREADAKMHGYTPSTASNQQPTTHAPVLGIPKTTVPVVKKSVGELLKIEFGKVHAHLTKFKNERVCHPQHVHDFCKLSSGGGYEYTFDADAKKLKGTFGGNSATIEKEFILN